VKRVLLLTPFTPDNQGVGVSYTSQLLKELAKTCFIDLVYFRYEEDKPYETPLPEIRVIREEVIRGKDKIISLLHSPITFPLFTARYKKDVCLFLQQQVANNRYDFLYFDFSQTFSYAKYINHPNKILMAHDVIAQKYSRMKTFLRPWAIMSERRMLNLGTVVFTFSDKDCKLIKDLYGINAKSTTFFLNPNVIKAVPDIYSDYFVFFGAWNRPENNEALCWYMDNVYDHLSLNIKYKIIGGGKMPDSLMRRIGNCPNIEYLGFVDDPYPLIANARAEIAPLHMGAGVKVKCVEALGCGTSIIGTEVAFEGIGEIYRDAMFEANSAEEYVDIISSFNYSLDEKRKLKRLFIKNYNNKQILNYING